MSLKPCSNKGRVELVHRANDLAIIDAHSDQYSCYEIDVQLFDEAIYVYHDDMQIGGNTNVIELAEFLKGVPPNFTLNVELKVYGNRNSIDIHTLCSKVVDICGRRADIDYIFSSFCADVYEWFRDRGYSNVMMLADTVEAYRLNGGENKPWMCVDANLLDQIIHIRPSQQRVYVYNIRLDQVQDLIDDNHMYVSGYIFDF
jgi:hypothetical protein